jgi:hypothetical protein
MLIMLQSYNFTRICQYTRNSARRTKVKGTDGAIERPGMVVLCVTFGHEDPRRRRSGTPIHVTICVHQASTSLPRYKLGVGHIDGATQMAHSSLVTICCSSFLHRQSAHHIDNIISRATLESFTTSLMISLRRETSVDLLSTSALDGT